MIPIGATVRWRHKIDKRATVIGVVTGHPQPRMVEVDGKGWISEGLLEVVGEMAHMTDGMTEKDARDGYAESQQKIMRLFADLSMAEQERDALRELVVSQATTNAELAEELERMRKSWTRAAARAEEYANEIERLEEFEQIAKDAATYVEDLLLLFMGERRPVRPIEPPELRRLAEFVFEGA